MNRATFVAATIFAGTLGCAGESAGGNDSPRGGDPPDPDSQIALVDLVARAPDDAGLARLEEMIASDASGHVRERALLAYGGARGRDALGLLKSVALHDADVAVAATARAEIERIREESPEPPRGWMKLAFPETFVVGEPFAVSVSFGSEQAVPRVRFELRVPPELDVLSPGGARWSGSLEAGEQREVTFELRASGEAPRAGLRARLKLDYPEMLDVEVHQERLRIAMTGASGRLGRLPEQTEPRFP